MIPTVAQASDLARALLNDTSSQVFTDAVLLPYIQSRFRRLFSEMLRNGVPAVERFTFYNLPAYTGIIKPSQLGVADMGEPTKLEERSVDFTTTVTGSDTASPITITTAASHGRSAGQRVVVYGVAGQTGANGEFYVAVPSASQLTLNGSVSEGAYSSGGAVSYSAERFTEVDSVDALSETEPIDRLTEWEWTGEGIRVIPATTIRMIKLTYKASGTAPASGSLLIDDSFEYIAYGAASDAALPTDMTTLHRQYKIDAEVKLADLIQTMVRQQQHQQRRQAAFGERQMDDSQIYF